MMVRKEMVMPDLLEVNDPPSNGLGEGAEGCQGPDSPTENARGISALHPVVRKAFYLMMNVI